MMISSDFLKRFNFFKRMTNDQLNTIAAIADEANVPQGSTIFEEKKPAIAFFFLIEGYIDLYQRTFDTYHPKVSKDLLVGAVHPREIFGLSAIVEPFVYNATARTASPCHFIQFDGAKLRELIECDYELGYMFMKQISIRMADRLMDMRVQLAAAWVDSQKK
jgi:CRP-like cAMP-binding protein